MMEWILLRNIIRRCFQDLASPACGRSGLVFLYKYCNLYTIRHKNNDKAEPTEKKNKLRSSWPREVTVLMFTQLTVNKVFEGQKE